MQGYHALQAHRVAHWLWNRGSTVLALALQARMSEVHSGSYSWVLSQCSRISRFSWELEFCQYWTSTNSILLLDAKAISSICNLTGYFGMFLWCGWFWCLLVDICVENVNSFVIWKMTYLLLPFCYVVMLTKRLARFLLWTFIQVSLDYCIYRFYCWSACAWTFYEKHVYRVKLNCLKNLTCENWQ